MCSLLRISHLFHTFLFGRDFVDIEIDEQLSFLPYLCFWNAKLAWADFEFKQLSLGSLEID